LTGLTFLDRRKVRQKSLISNSLPFILEYFLVMFSRNRFHGLVY
jgi:hypothetical protein